MPYRAQRCAISILTVGLTLGLTVATPEVAAQSLHAAVLPNDAGTLRFSSTRVVRREFFATLLNDSEQTAEGCRIELVSELPVQLDYVTTEPTLNRVVGLLNSPVSIPPFSGQTFRFSLQLTADDYIPMQHVGVRFVCDSLPVARVIPAINDVLLEAGEPPLPNLLLAVATDQPDNRLLLDPSPGGEPCQAAGFSQGEILPCAVGAAALAVFNAEPVPVAIRVIARGPSGRSLLCETDLTGRCTRVAPPSEALDLELQPGQVSTFSAFFVGLDDNTFGACCGPDTAGFIVQERSPLGRVRAVADARVPIDSPAFEWSARIVDDELKVMGTVTVSSSCPKGVLTESPSDSAEELRLELTINEAAPGEICFAAFTKKSVQFSRLSPAPELERVVVSFEGADDLVLNVERDL